MTGIGLPMILRISCLQVRILLSALQHYGATNIGVCSTLEKCNSVEKIELGVRLPLAPLGKLVER